MKPEVRIAFSNAKAIKPPRGLLTIPNGGEAHIRSGHILDGPYFVTKIAMMARANRACDLHTSDGVVGPSSAETGFLLAVMHDRTYLTDI